jgi:hypothetical protein
MPDGYKHRSDMSPYEPLLVQQDVPCTAGPATCTRLSGQYACTPGMLKLSAMPAGSTSFHELKPGSPAVCGHGNREFSFLVSKRPKVKSVLLFLMAGGMCWDAKTCGDPKMRSMAVDAMIDPAELAPTVPIAYKMATSNSGRFNAGILSDTNTDFKDWSVVMVPDCTGDLHVGNRSYTYDPGHTTCITAHHRGGVNTGLAVQWMLEEFPELEHVVIIGTGLPASKASGGHGAAFWTTYIQSMAPKAKVRTIVDSSMAVFGPDWQKAMADDPWGTLATRVGPKSDHFLMPHPGDWFIAYDDLASLYEKAAARMRALAFLDISSVGDAVQRAWFQMTGGEDLDCCLDGCGCEGMDPDQRTGLLDWAKARKVAILRRARIVRRELNLYFQHHYRSWITAGEAHFQLMSNARMMQNVNGGTSGRTLTSFIKSFVESNIVLNQEGFVAQSTLPDVSYSARVYGSATCTQCLDGVLGARTESAEVCNMTAGPGESLFSVAPKFGTDWMLLWSLNGGDTPDSAKVGSLYRFAHEYVVRAGESLEGIAARFGTTVDALVKLNYNLITHIQNPQNLQPGDKICVLPGLPKVVDRQGNPVCPSEKQILWPGVSRQGPVDVPQEAPFNKDPLPGVEDSN